MTPISEHVEPDTRERILVVAEQMIAQAANKPGPSLDQMVDFILAGLAARGKAAKH